MSRHTRRDFLKSTAAAGLATSFTIAGTKASGQVLGANERLRIAVCGLNGRGRSHASEYVDMDNVELAYVVDPDEAGAGIPPRNRILSERKRKGDSTASRESPTSVMHSRTRISMQSRSPHRITGTP